MEQKKSLFEILEEIVSKDPRYEVEAYNFILLAFNFTMNRISEHRHMTGRELLGGVKEYALDQYGPMTRTVLEHWGITCTEDFGEIVFNLVDNGLLGKSETDSRDDFKNVFDFATAFDSPFQMNN